MAIVWRHGGVHIFVNKRAAARGSLFPPRLEKRRANHAPVWIDLADGAGMTKQPHVPS